MTDGHAHAPHGTQPLPRTTLAWLACVLVAASAIGFGLYCFSVQFQRGFIATGLRTPGQGGAAWGLYIAFDVIWVGVSFAGITVAAMCRLFDISALKPVTRIAELLTITALVGGGALAVLSDLGRPAVGLLNLPKYANPHSPFFGTFTLVLAGYLFSSVVYFFLAGRADAAATARTASRGRWVYRLWASGWADRPADYVRHHKVSFVLALSILPLLVTAHSTLGFIFGIQSGRPGWYSALQAPGFVIMAGVSGTGMVILLTIGLRKLLGLQDRIPDTSIRWLGNFMWVLALVYLYFMVVEELTATYAAPEADRHVAHQIVGGRFAPIFWTVAICLFLAFLLPFLLYLRKRTSIAVVGLAALLANVAAVLKRYLIVVPSQIEGVMTPVETHTAYKPTFVEYGIVGGMFGVVVIMVLLFVRVFPIVATVHDAPPPTRLPRDFRRVGATITTALFALVMIVVGLSDSFRLWSSEIDPTIPFSPVIFANGVMLLFVSAIVYEVFPTRRRGARGRIVDRARLRLAQLQRVGLARPVHARPVHTIASRPARPIHATERRSVPAPSAPESVDPHHGGSHHE